jgi:hypothetical protein
MTLLAFERRWAHAVLEAFAPPGGVGLAPQPGEVDYVGGMQRMLGSFTTRAALGLRAGLWIAALAPLWMGGRLASMARMSLEARTELVRRLLVHRSFLVRELTFLLKTAASFALLGTSSIRARSNYDRGTEPVWGEAADAKLRLPVARALISSDPPTPSPPPAGETPGPLGASQRSAPGSLEARTISSDPSTLK